MPVCLCICECVCECACTCVCVCVLCRLCCLRHTPGSARVQAVLPRPAPRGAVRVRTGVTPAAGSARPSREGSPSPSFRCGPSRVPGVPDPASLRAGRQDTTRGCAGDRGPWGHGAVLGAAPQPRRAQGVAAGTPLGLGLAWGPQRVPVMVWQTRGPGAARHPSSAGSGGPHVLGAVGPAWLWRGVTVSQGDDSGVLPQQRWSNRRRARCRAMTIFTFPETASCSSNLPQLGSLPRQEAAVTAAAVGSSGSAGAAWAGSGTAALRRVGPCPLPCPYPHRCTPGAQADPDPCAPLPLPAQPHSTAPPHLMCPHSTAALPHGTAATGSQPPAPRPRPLCPMSLLPALHRPPDAGSLLGWGKRQIVK